MTSECFVYITLPGATEAVTAGRFRLSADRHGVPVGEFVYGKSYLSRPDRVDIDPVELRLSVGQLRTARLGGIFGAIRDAAPDSWGRRLIEKRAGVGANEIDYLLNSPDDRAGALGFGFGVVPPAPIPFFNRTMDLQLLVKVADEILIAEMDPGALRPIGHDVQQVQSLLSRVGTSMGGARPKATVEDGNELWLAKFSRPDDRWNNPRVEHAVMSLARSCGVNCAETRIETVGDRDVILVKRFDRQRCETGYLRRRMVSALTLLGADESRDDRWSYLAFAREMGRSGMQRDLPELFRRICFNALVSNTDDHPRNHACVAAGRDWALSPAYDVVPTPMVATERRDLAMILGDAGRFANRANLLSQCGRFRISRDEAQALIDAMAERIRFSWYRTARQAGVTELDCAQIQSAFVYDGFDFDLPDAEPMAPAAPASPF